MATTNKFRPQGRSQISELYTEPFDGSPVTIHLDCELTRRKRFHCVVSERGSVLFRSRLVSDCISWLDSEGVEQYNIDAGNCLVVVRGRSAQAHLEP